MTKDEMVQRLYIEYVKTSSEFESDALELAESNADYFFEHYKPQKKREVFLISQGLLVALEDAVIKHIPPGFYSEWSLAYNALFAGKSVRMKK